MAYLGLTAYISGLSLLPLPLIVILLVGAFFYFEEYVLFGQKKFEYYDDLQHSLSNSSGLFLRIYDLPFPVNDIILSIYMLMMPQPATGVLFAEGRTILNLPYLISPYLTCLFVAISIYYICFVNKDKSNIHIYILMSLLMFFIIVASSPDVRRTFAVIPSLYLCYCLIEDRCPRYIKSRLKAVVWSLTFVVSITFVFYTFGK